MKTAYIVKAYRTAVGKAPRGVFRFKRADELGAETIQHMMKELPNLDVKRIDDVIVGNAMPEGAQGLNMGRFISLIGLNSVDVPGVTVNRFCSSGLETIGMATAKIQAGMADCIIAGGAESMSMIPFAGYKLAPSYKANLENLNYHVGMGATAEAVAGKYNISREAADKFSYDSHMKAASAIDGGKFKDQIVPIEIEEVFVADGKRKTKTHTVSVDEGVRRETSLEGLAKLRPAFKIGGTVTAGNASQTSDGAAFTLVVSEEMVKQLNLKPIARMAGCAVGGVEPLYMGIGPCIAIPKVLKQAGLLLKDIQQTELNEAFGAQALAVIQEAGLDPETVNVNGGAIALGHPLGCTGAKLTIQLLDEMQRRKQRYGMVTACVGGGQGIAGVFERL